VLAGLAALLLPAEFLLRIAPPDDLAPYLGAASDLSGPYRPDPILGAAYRSADALRQQYPQRLAELAKGNAGRPIWAMFGNSFVQAHGMLGDTAQAALPERQIFFLQRNEPAFLRVGQFRVLLDDGLRPERAFFVLLPVDFIGIAENPVAGVAVTPRGGLGRLVQARSFLLPVLEDSRLALAAWVRSGRGRPLPDFRSRDVLKVLPEPIHEDLKALLGEIARSAGRHGVPVSIVFIPNREQIMGDPSTVPQDAIAAAAAPNPRSGEYWPSTVLRLSPWPRRRAASRSLPAGFRAAAFVAASAGASRRGSASWPGCSRRAPPRSPSFISSSEGEPACGPDCSSA
jgi:hypothetical protein